MDESEKISLKRKHESSTRRVSNEETEENPAKRRRSIHETNEETHNLTNDASNPHLSTSVGQNSNQKSPETIKSPDLNQKGRRKSVDSTKFMTFFGQKVKISPAKPKRTARKSFNATKIDLEENKHQINLDSDAQGSLEDASSETLASVDPKVKRTSKKIQNKRSSLTETQQQLDTEDKSSPNLLVKDQNQMENSQKTIGQHDMDESSTETPSVDQNMKETPTKTKIANICELKQEMDSEFDDGDSLDIPGDKGTSTELNIKPESSQNGDKTRPSVFNSDYKLTQEQPNQSQQIEVPVKRSIGRPRMGDKYNNPIWAKVVANFNSSCSETSVVDIINPVKPVKPPKRKITVEEILTGSSDEDQKPNRRALPKKGEKSGRRRRPRKAMEDLVTTHKSRTDEVNQIQITMSTTQLKEVPVEVPKNKSDIIKNFFDTGKMTYRVMKRANFVIETVRQEKVIVDLTKLMRAIKDEEMGEGYNATIDKKSLMRLILKLSRDGHIKFRKATLRSDSKEKCVCFICDPNIEDDHSVITSALEQSKMKFFIGTKEKKDQPTIIEEKDLPLGSKDSVKSVVLQENFEEGDKKMTYKYDRNASKAYGLCPKFVRTRLMHEFLYYLIYEDNPQQPITDREDIEKLFFELGIKDEVFENDQFCTVYRRELNWKLFVPALPKHNGWPRGWTLICDVLLRLPLSTFLKCFNVPYQIPEVHYYLNHPVRKYFLVKNLPPKIRNGLMHGRKYIFSMHEVVTRLCHMGLVQFGPQKLKEKDQIFLYLNKNASLLNTVKSPPGYHKVGDLDYEKIRYCLRTPHDVDTYWYELWSICINTRLGTRLSVTGQYIVLEQVNTKPDLIIACKPKTAEEADAFDNGDIPGDHKGAAGLDSALFAHLKRNWNWSDLLNYPEKQASKPTRFETTSEPPKKLEIIGKPLDKPRKFKVKKREMARKKIRHVLPKKKPKNKQPMYDEKDKICLKKMQKLRTDWTQIEDNVLLLCTVASIYLCPNRRRQSVEYTVMRDVLHRMVAYAQDKTSRSCQRRINYIMKNLKTRRSVHMCLEELRQCEYVVEKYGAIAKKYTGQTIPILTLNIAFIELVGYLNRRFSNQIPTRSKPVAAIPDTIQEIKLAYDIVSNNKKGSAMYKDVETTTEIQFDVIRSVIHSSLCCTKDKTSWAFQLFKIYQQYPEALLRSVISKIRHDQMVSVKKALMKTNMFPSGCLPFSSPFQLSISYAYQLQNTRFHYDYYNEANSFLKNVLTWLETYSVHKTDDHLEITLSDNGTAVLLENIMQKLNIEFIFDHPEQVIVLDPVITNDAAYERIVNRYNEILKDPAQIDFWEEPKNDDDEENFPDFTPPERPKHIDLNSAMIGRFSRIAFHMMRAQMCEGIDKNGAQHIHDYFVVNASRVFLKIPEEEHNWEQYNLHNLQVEGKVLDVIEKIKSNAFVPSNCGRITSEDAKNFFPTKTLTDYDFEYIEKLKCTIWDSKELGSTVSHLSQVAPDSSKTLLSLLDVLNLLQYQKVVYRVGVLIPRFVHFDHKAPWVVNVDKIVRLEREKMDKDLSTKWKGKRLIKAIPEDDNEHKKIKLIVCPWIRLDGSVNRRVLDRWFGAILTCIMEDPGISLHDLTRRYDYLKPVEILSVVESLTELSCVNLTKIRKPKVSLFSTEPDFDFEPANILNDPKKIMIEPREDAIFKFATFVGQKNYGTNFID